MSKLTESLPAAGNVHLKQEKVYNDAFFSLLALKVSSLEVARRSTVSSTWTRVACGLHICLKKSPKIYVYIYNYDDRLYYTIWYYIVLHYTRQNSLLYIR